jgi:hypothetical protein
LKHLSDCASSQLPLPHNELPAERPRSGFLHFKAPNISAAPALPIVGVDAAVGTDLTLCDEFVGVNVNVSVRVNVSMSMRIGELKLLGFRKCDMASLGGYKIIGISSLVICECECECECEDEYEMWRVKTARTSNMRDGMLRRIRDFPDFELGGL